MAEVGFHHVINLILAQLNERFKMWQELPFTARLEEDVKFSLRDIYYKYRTCSLYKPFLNLFLSQLIHFAANCSVGLHVPKL